MRFISFKVLHQFILIQCLHSCMFSNKYTLSSSWWSILKASPTLSINQNSIMKCGGKRLKLLNKVFGFRMKNLVLKIQWIMDLFKVTLSKCINIFYPLYLSFTVIFRNYFQHFKKTERRELHIYLVLVELWVHTNEDLEKSSEWYMKTAFVFDILFVICI